MSSFAQIIRPLVRAAAPSTCRQTRAGLARQVARRTIVTLQQPRILTALSSSPSLQSRSFSSSRLCSRQQLNSKWTNGEPVTYEELKPITQSPNDNVLLVDVREPSEVALGSIPSSVNLPLTTFEKSLSMDEGDFTRTHGFHKPSKQQPIIFYCKAGVRAQTAVELAKRAGYKTTRNYKGSYDDWVKRDSKSDD
ncbi:hypothetical protein OIO90_004931 [Microbotryomycetes sp. JL221]|nr:hypothetical protein OIO90_004931 [Microbotryomycetes sp. JL221]